jgi:UDP-MurNAc hydroxylase
MRRTRSDERETCVEITFLGQAGMFIDTKYGSILCDPWFHGAYFASWFPFPSNEEVDVAKISRPTYLFVSHLHRDHFDEAFLRENVSKDATVLLPAFGVDALEKALRALGFTKFIHAPNGELLDLGGLTVGVMAMVTPMDGPIGDAALMVDDGETRLFNQNDSRPIDMDKVHAWGPYDAHFVQFSGAIWYPMVYDYTPEKKREIATKKRANQLARSLKFIEQIGAKFSFPSAGPPCFLDDALFDLNDFDRDPSNTFPDQPTFLDYMQEHGNASGRLLIPGSVARLENGTCKIEHAVSDAELHAIFHHKRAYLERYKARMQPQIDAVMDALPRHQVDILSELKGWFEPLLVKADYTCIGVNSKVMLDLGEERDAKIVIDFQRREVYPPTSGVEVDYVFRMDRGLVEHCILSREEDWVNTIFLSCRFSATRKGPFNEYVYNFFKCLSPARVAYAESCYSERVSVDQLFEIEGHVVQRRCPHLKVDLMKFGHVDNGVMTCTLHGWQFELATGKCLTSEGHRLYSRPVENPETCVPAAASESRITKRKRKLDVAEEPAAAGPCDAVADEIARRRAG